MNQRNQNYDRMKVFAICSVILLHLFLGSPYLFNNKQSYYWIAVITVYSITRVSVPLFFMISGALLLNKREITFKYSSYKIKKLIFPMVVTSVLYYIYMFRNVSGLKNDAIHMLWKPISLPHLWYLYALIGIYLLLPIHKKVVDACNQKELATLLVIWAIFTGANVFLKYFGNMDLGEYYGIFPTYASSYLGYFYLGYYLSKYGKTFQMKTLAVVSAVVLYLTVCLVMIENQSIMLTDGMFSDKFLTFYSLNIILLSICIFKMFSNRKENKTEQKTGKIIQFIANNTLIIYLFHEIVLQILRRYLDQYMIDHAVAYILVYFVTTLVVSIGAAWILKMGRMRIKKR